MQWFRTRAGTTLVVLASLSSAYLIQAFAWSVFRSVPFMAFFLAVFLSAFVGGLRAGLSATLLGAFLVNYRFIEPTHLLSFEPSAVFATIGFVVCGTLFSILSESRLHSLASAEHALRAREEFLAIAAHELRTPLTTLRLRLQLLRKQGLGDQLEPLERTVRRMGRLVEQLLAQEQELRLSRVDVSEVARETVEGFAGDGETNPVSLHCTGPVVGSFDRELISRIAASLIGNALKYGAGKPIDVRVAREDGNAVLEVEDQGIGIPPRDQARIFDAYQRAVPVRNFGGLGLGLYIARSAAQAHGGDIHVRSQPGEGATFRVELPIR